MALILVADDARDIRDLVQIRLEAWGHEVLAVADGEAALDALEEYPFDLAMIDLTMPGLSGIGVVNQVRAYEAEEGLEALPIVMISGSSRPHDIARAQAAGVDEYLVKPFRLNTLTAIVGAMVPTVEAVTVAAGRHSA